MKLTAVQVLGLFAIANHFEHKVTRTSRGSYQIDVTLDWSTTESGRNLPNVINVVVGADGEVDAGEYDWFINTITNAVLEDEERERKYQESIKNVRN